jgi:hypothetical protein
MIVILINSHGLIGRSTLALALVLSRALVPRSDKYSTIMKLLWQSLIMLSPADHPYQQPWPHWTQFLALSLLIVLFCFVQ